MRPLTCSDCGNGISRQSKTGRCRSCALVRVNADPEIRARQRAAAKAYAAQPSVKAACAARLAAHVANMSDAERERRRARGRHIAATILHAEAVRARSNSREAKRKAGVARTNTVLAWCPPEYRQRYRDLKASQLMRASEARAMIEDEIAADRRRAWAAMSPLDRDLERMRNGAALVPTFRPTRVEPGFTLGGIGSAAL